MIVKAQDPDEVQKAIGTPLGIVGKIGDSHELIYKGKSIDNGRAEG
jgi:hypothetical protein